MSGLSFAPNGNQHDRESQFTFSAGSSLDVRSSTTYGLSGLVEYGKRTSKMVGHRVESMGDIDGVSKARYSMISNMNDADLEANIHDHEDGDDGEHEPDDHDFAAEQSGEVDTAAAPTAPTPLEAEATFMSYTTAKDVPGVEAGAIASPTSILLLEGDSDGERVEKKMNGKKRVSIVTGNGNEKAGANAQGERSKKRVSIASVPTQV
jgi:hypothetical protein